ncbi:MAG: cell wall metabolism sensor histidine kinase WalK [Cyanobacteria bacterium]|nr:cell wall metabolism sensor histidine kinase WalK [Cyanobacteria bacterium CG_2015-16_32_12]NCO76864.1 cell wall metabolism sensor histidine kinase WalK [Cyanobacteria bacterium CG_2015-22_32_23]NCQ03643.1 cell wall metabolism sensor histidine kinase WalK [Cyanobacteria bacterium CG_2015-09_32_10]NCQ40914.1 cell wall metabolism sensor histidine kinase WalK [Cyanobacteria bacterium CG_2015-04_32_10]NCS84749.1 cell wall metabolism sensor histidine kinase WalK [Cyanobacteria bacterium CG_2015-0
MQVLKEIIARWWSEFTLQTKLMAIATLVVSLVMSSLTFWAVNSIQKDAQMNDTRFGRDLGLLLASNVAPLIGEDKLTEVAQFSGRFFNSTSSVRYIIYANEEGHIFFGIPFSQDEVKNSLTIQRKLELPEDYQTHVKTPVVRQHLTPDGIVTDVFVPLFSENQYLGVLAIGINPNPTVVASSNLTRDVTIAVFISIWAMVILGGVFNALTITQPIKELLLGVKNIATGNFKQRIDLPLGGELGELILSFNDMAEILEKYEEQNIEELTAEKAKLETLVSTIADGAILLDSQLKLILVNPAARRMFEWEETHIIGENLLEYLPLEVTQQLQQPLKNISQGEDQQVEKDHNNILPTRGEFTINLNSSNPHTFRILLTQVFDQNRENIKGIVMTVQDITKEAELNEAKSQFISNVSHELRTPLFNIKSFIETLFEYGEDLTEAEKLEFLQTANNETDRLTRLVNDVLDLSRLESSRSYQFSPLDLAQPIEQTLRTYQLNAKDKNIKLIQNIEPSLPPIWGHYDLLLQVFTNLVGNALKFTLDEGSVTIKAYAVQNNPENPSEYSHVRVEITDTGIGIAPEDQEAIFERFFRVENRVHTLEGTGLGLSIVKNIADKHNSQIHLTSEVGVGTTFWFDLQIYQDHRIH